MLYSSLEAASINTGVGDIPLVPQILDEAMLVDDEVQSVAILTHWLDTYNYNTLKRRLCGKGLLDYRAWLRFLGQARSLER